MYAMQFGQSQQKKQQLHRQEGEKTAHGNCLGKKDVHGFWSPLVMGHFKDQGGDRSALAKKKRQPVTRG